MKLFLKILVFILIIFQSNICEAKVFVFKGLVSQVAHPNIFSSEKSCFEVEYTFSKNALTNTCKNENDLLDYRGLLLDFQAYAAKTSTKLISQFSTSTIDDAVGLVMKDPNKIAHLFAPKHNLGGLVSKFGGQENTVRAVLNAANGKLPASGVFNNIPVSVGGQNILLRGSVINGVPRLGTMFIP